MRILDLLRADVVDMSAPVVAAAYQPSLAAVGLLMAIIGNILGTFGGLFVVAQGLTS